MVFRTLSSSVRRADAERGESHAQTHNVVVRSLRTSIRGSLACSRARGSRSDTGANRQSPGRRDRSSLASRVGSSRMAPRLAPPWVGLSPVGLAPSSSPMVALWLGLAVLWIRVLLPALLLRRVLSLSLRLAASPLASLWLAAPSVGPPGLAASRRLGPPPPLGSQNFYFLRPFGHALSSGLRGIPA